MNSTPGKMVVKSKVKRGFPSKCMCGSDVQLYTSKTQENPGRPFHRCVTMLDDHLFKWVEESMREELEDALPKVENIETEVYNVKSEVESLRDVIYELKQDVMWSKVELMKWKLITKSVGGCLCLIFIVIVIAFLFF